MVKKNYHLLVVDDEQAQVEALSGYLKKQGYQVSAMTSATEAVEQVKSTSVDVVFSDIRMPEMNGLELLKAVKSINPDIDMIMMTAFGQIEDAVGAMKAGAEDYMQKPVDLDQLDLVLKRVLDRRRLISENALLKSTLSARRQFSHMIVSSPVMEEVLNVAIRAAASKATVLINGESGTGKELLARSVHLASPRRDQPFVGVNIAALPENLAESELFGHVKGAFTGADRERKGRFEEAEGGTLFFDEISEIPLNIQVKLLRVLQERVFERVGSSRPVQADVRVVAATNQDLEALVQSGAFREDLFYRLNVISIPIPPLRKRRKEIPALTDHFLRKYCEQEARSLLPVSKEAMDYLMKHDYPGNVRELENMVQRAIVLAREDVITVDDFVSESAFVQEKLKIPQTLNGEIEQLERQRISEELEISGHNQSQAARALGLTERNLRYKMKKYGMK